VAVDDAGLYWWHSIRLPDGTVTPGEKSPELLEQQWEALRLPPLTGKTVLDIGAWDGWFAFRAEAEGAARVVALDSYVWALDFSRADDYRDYVRARQAQALPYDLWGPDCAYWDADGLPGKRSFDHARAALASRVEPVVADIVRDNLEQLGDFDINLFVGVLYHLREPLRSLSRLRSLTRELAVIETAAVRVEGLEDAALIEFIEGDELNNDASNWHVPTEQALHGMCRAAGFSNVETIDAGPDLQARGKFADYRLTVHARP
jgi:tRNA (mo5U34)-methyltransferase